MKRILYKEEVNFVTLTIVGWIDLFIRPIYNDFIIESLRYCHEKKGLEIYAYVLMTSHLHMIADGESLSDILRDMKTYTSKGLIKLIKTNEQESRKQWLLRMFGYYGTHHPKNKFFKIWQDGNFPIALYSNYVINQKINYIHLNPVKAGIVDDATCFRYSSANPWNPLRDILVRSEG